MTKQTDITNIEPIMESNEDSWDKRISVNVFNLILKQTEIIAAIRYLGDNCAMVHGGEGVEVSVEDIEQCIAENYEKRIHFMAKAIHSLVYGKKEGE